jgi:hypothetical protein
LRTAFGGVVEGKRSQWDKLGFWRSRQSLTVEFFRESELEKMTIRETRTKKKPCKRSASLCARNLEILSWPPKFLGATFTVASVHSFFSSHVKDRPVAIAWVMCLVEGRERRAELFVIAASHGPICQRLVIAKWVGTTSSAPN